MELDSLTSILAAASGCLGAVGSLLLSLPFLDDLRWRKLVRQRAAALKSSGASIAQLDQFWLDQAKLQAQPQGTWVTLCAIVGCMMLFFSLTLAIPAVQICLAKWLLWTFAV